MPSKEKTYYISEAYASSIARNNTHPSTRLLAFNMEFSPYQVGLDLGVGKMWIWHVPLWK